MKRKSLKFFACAAIMAMTLSVAGCGGSDDKAKTVDAGAKTEAAEDTKADAAADSADDATSDAADDAASDAADDTASDADTATTLEELCNDPSARSTLDAAFGAMAQDGMSVDYEAKGNELAIIIKIEDSSLVVDGMGEALGAALDSQADALKTQVKTFDDAVGQAGACTVTMRYLDPDGNVIVEKSYKAE